MAKSFSPWRSGYVKTSHDRIDKDPARHIRGAIAQHHALAHPESGAELDQHGGGWPWRVSDNDIRF